MAGLPLAAGLPGGGRDDRWVGAYRMPLDDADALYLVAASSGGLRGFRHMGNESFLALHLCQLAGKGDYTQTWWFESSPAGHSVLPWGDPGRFHSRRAMEHNRYRNAQIDVSIPILELRRWSIYS